MWPVHKKFSSQSKQNLNRKPIYRNDIFPRDLKRPNKKTGFVRKCVTFFKKRFYLFESERGRKYKWRKGRGRGKSRLPFEQGARCGAWSQNPEMMTWAKGRHLTAWNTQAPQNVSFYLYKAEWHFKFDHQFNSIYEKI